jgi:hypothetical protein
MTDKKSLKKRVRARQTKTGERYTTALRHIQAMNTDPRQTELHDVSHAAELEGFACRAFVSEHLWRAECALGAPDLRFREVLGRLRTLLRASASSDAAAKLARLVLHGERGAVGVGSAVEEMFTARDFLAQAHAGVRGVSRNGRVVVFDVPRGEAVVAIVLASPYPREGQVPLLWLSALCESGQGLGDALARQFSLAGIGGWHRATV